jgi:hypothetical protein
VTALEEALHRAQAQAIAELQRAYVGGRISPADFAEALKSIGFTDRPEVNALVSTLDVLGRLGGASSAGAFDAPQPSSQSAWPGVWPRGTHKGRALSETPSDYLEWYVDKGLNANWREVCANELALRAAGVL